MMDQNKPARFLDTAYNALKANPNATNQILQAAAQGQPVGLRGLAAAAAQQNQQEAQQAMAAQQMQAQGPQQSIIQKLAGASGIMGQLPSSLQLASAPTGPAPEEMPQQMMAGGGLVSFADGGNVLPPDVIEAIQSHFADGGEVRGFAKGEGVAAGYIPDQASLLRNTVFENIPHEGGVSPVVDYHGRKIVVANIYGEKVPFYVSTGSGGKASVPAGKWYPYFGHDPETGWFNKSSEAEINRYYDSPVLEDVAKYLDNAVGDIRHDTRWAQGEIPSISRGSQAMDFINDGLSPTGRQGSHEAFRSNVQNTLNRVHDAVLSGPKNAPTAEAPFTGAAPTQASTPSNPIAEMTARLSDATKAKLRGMNPTDAMEEMKRLTPESWTTGAADEAFNFGKLGELAGKVPESVKATGRFLGNLSPYAWALDPRVRAAAEISTSGAKMASGMPSGVEGVLEGMGELRGSKSNPAEGLDWLARGGIQELLGFSHGGDVRGFASGDLLKSLAGPSESPGMGLLNKFAGLFAPEVNPAISREELEQRRALRQPTAVDISPEDIIEVADVDPRSRKTNQPQTWKPEPHDGHEVVPRQRVLEEGTKVDKKFEQAKKDVPSAAVTPDSEAQGLGGLDQGKEMVDYIKSLYGEKKMDPEIAKKLADLESNARTSTILQSVLGGLAGGLSNPYGGRFALGSAALQALGGYQKGIGSEEDIQRKALDIERAYADQPADLQRTAAKEYFDLAKEKAKLLSAERVAGERSESALDRLLRSEEGKLLRSQIMSGQKGDVTEGQKLTAWNQAREQAAKEIKDEYIGATPPEGELERRTQKHYLAALNSIITATGGGLGAGQAQQQQSGLGAGAIPTGRSIIGGKLTGSSPQ